MNALSDSHSVSFDFEELQPEFGDVRLEVFFNGTAELENDGDGFFVRSIAIDATTSSPFAKTYLARKARKPAYLVVNQSSHLESPELGALYTMLSRALYKMDAAKEAWASEVAEAA